MRLKDADVISGIMYRKAFEEDSDLQRWDNGCWIRYKMFEQALEEAPTVEAEPVRRGRWIPFDLTWGRSVYSCTCCKEAMEVPYACGEPMFKFCPNCGAQMEEQE